MPACCPCNAKGGGQRCINCVCVKAKVACSNCAPSRADPSRCLNRAVPVVDAPPTGSLPASCPVTFSAAVSTPTRQSSEIPASCPARSCRRDLKDDQTAHSISLPSCETTSRPAVEGTQPVTDTASHSRSTSSIVGDTAVQNEVSNRRERTGNALLDSASDIDTKLEEVYGDKVLSQWAGPRSR